MIVTFYMRLSIYTSSKWLHPSHIHFLLLVAPPPSPKRFKMWPFSNFSNKLKSLSRFSSVLTTQGFYQDKGIDGCYKGFINDLKRLFLVIFGREKYRVFLSPKNEKKKTLMNPDILVTNSTRSAVWEYFKMAKSSDRSFEQISSKVITCII